MVEAFNSLTSAVASKSNFAAQPVQQNVLDFQGLMNEANPLNNTVKNFVEKAQDRLEVANVDMNKDLKEFDMKDSVLSLIKATHQSSMNSISVQLTGKIGSKVSESFEQLVKQN